MQPYDQGLYTETYLHLKFMFRRAYFQGFNSKTENQSCEQKEDPVKL